MHTAFTPSSTSTLRPHSVLTGDARKRIIRANILNLLMMSSIMLQFDAIHLLSVPNATIMIDLLVAIRSPAQTSTNISIPLV